jgi:hypothetical protein
MAEWSPSMAYFYEIRSSNNAVLKRDGGFPTQPPRRLRDAKTPRKRETLGSRTPWMLGGHGGTECGKGYAVPILVAQPDSQLALLVLTHD